MLDSFLPIVVLLKAVILAAGEGTRLLPLSSTRPKHMLPVAGRPLLEHLLSALKANRVDEVMLVVKFDIPWLHPNLLNEMSKFTPVVASLWHGLSLFMKVFINALSIVTRWVRSALENQF